MAAGDRVCRLTALARHVKQIASLTLEVKGTAVLAVVVAGAVVDVSQVDRGCRTGASRRNEGGTLSGDGVFITAAEY